MYRIIGADQREYGPVSRETLVQWIAERRAHAQTPVQAAGASDWQPLGTLPEFAGAFAPADAAMKPPVATCVPITPLPAQQVHTNGWATASLVMGLLAVTCGCCCCYGFPFNLFGVLFGLIALVQIGRAPRVERGRELAIAGLVLSILSLALSVFVGLFSLLAALPEFARESRHWRL
jgi:hypothetical protein